MDIAAWLHDLGLDRYVDAFENNAIEADLLPELTDTDLEKLGVVLGHRKRLLRAIAELTELEPAAGAPSSVHPGQAERRQLTVMFVDLVGSTKLSVRLDPEDMSTIIRAYQNAVAGEITRFEGHIAKYMGDGVLAYFGYPKAHEDEAERAVRTALALADAVGKLATPAGESLAARVGIATGLVVVGELIGEGSAEEQMVVGDTPNLAARLQTLAEPGGVVIAAGTRRLLGELFDLADLGTHDLKGFAEPVATFAVEGERSTESRFEAKSGSAVLPMVGRDQELALLLERWALAKAGEGQGVLLVGEAGIGKSRISRALLDVLAEEPHTRIRYQCSPYHTDSAFWPVIQQLSHAVGLAADDSIDASLDKVEALLDRAHGRDAASLIADLMGLDGAGRYGELGLTPQVQRARTLDALVAQLLGLAAAQPVLVVLEDAHWIDPTTLELIEQGLDRIAAARVLILLTSRPDQQPQLAAHPHVTRLTLNRLGRAGVEAIVARLGGDRLPDETIGTIVARTDGVPLFVEELTRAVLETDETTVPASLHDSLMARLDRLSEVKEVAQIGAVIGREFAHELVAAVAPLPEAKLSKAFDQLVASELIFRRGAAPAATYTFKHALVRDAAYQSLLRSRRLEIHARVAEVLETRFPDTVEVQPELLGYHLGEAGLAEPAIVYWRRAADRALRTSANLEAIGHYEKALGLLATLPQTVDRDRDEIDLQLGLGAALIAPRSYAAEEVRAAFARAEDLCRRIADTARHFRALRGLWNWHLLRANMQECERLADQLLSVAERSGEHARQLMAHRIVGTTNLGFGDYRAAKEHFCRGLDLYDRSEQDSYVLLYGEDPGLWCFVYSAEADDWLGQRDQALRWLEQGLKAARDLPHQYSLSFVLAFAATVHLYRREPEKTRRYAQEAIRVAREQGVAQWLAWGEIHHGWAVAAMGDVRSGLAQARAGFGAWDSLGLLYVQPSHLTILADIHRMAGDYEKGLKRLDEAEAIVREVGLRLAISEMYCLRGDILSIQSRFGEAEAQFQKSMEIAREQCARTFELRAATGLARLCRDQGKRTQARDLIAPVYEWFTEGFDTQDLIEAKALLDELP